MTAVSVETVDTEAPPAVSCSCRSGQALVSTPHETDLPAPLCLSKRFRMLRRSSAAIATSRAGHRSPISGREVQHQRWGRGRTQGPLFRKNAIRSVGHGSHNGNCDCVVCNEMRAWLWGPAQKRSTTRWSNHAQSLLSNRVVVRVLPRPCASKISRLQLQELGAAK